MTEGLSFFSYSRTDSAFVLKLAKDLRNAGARLWLDQLDIKAGSRWDASIEAALNASTSLIVVLTPASIASNNVMDEVSYALENDKKVIPVLWKDCATPFRLRRLQRIDFTGDYQLAFDELLEALDQSVNTDKNSNEALPESNPPPEPESVSNKKQKEQEGKLWKEACQSNTISSYRKYIDASLLGQYNEDAKKFIKQLELVQKNQQLDTQQWKKAEAENKLSSYLHYLERYPQGMYKKNALSAIAKLEEAQKEKNPLADKNRVVTVKANNYKKQFFIAGAVVIAGLATWLIIATISKNRKPSAGLGDDNYLFNHSKKKISKEFKVHTGPIQSLVFSPDGKTILTGSWDSTARLSDLHGNTLQQFKGHSDEISGAAFSPDGKSVLSGSYDKTARLWDLDGNVLREFKGHLDKVFSVNFSPDGKTILTGSADNTARLWDLNGNVLQTFHDSDIIISTAFSPDGKTILTGGGDHIARLRDLQGNLLQEFIGHTGGILSMAFSPDGKTIATTSWDSTVRLWDMKGNSLRIFKRHKDMVTCVTYSPNGEKVASASADEVFVYGIKGIAQWELTKFYRVFHSISFSPDGNQLLLGTSEGTVVFIP